MITIKRTLLAALLVVPMGIAIAAEQGRPAPYKMLDALLERRGQTDWPAVFALLDSMQGVIDVNEYTQSLIGFNATLLGLAVSSRNFLAVKTLLEKYKADPNRPALIYSKGTQFTPVELAERRGDNTLVKLLRSYGAR